MSFLSPLPGAGAGSGLHRAPGTLSTGELVLLASPVGDKHSPSAAPVREGRLSLERLLDEACHSHHSSQAEALDALAQGKVALARAPSAKQLDAFSNLPTGTTHPQRPGEPAGDAKAQQLEAAAGSLAAKLQEQLMPLLMQHMHEALAGAKGAVDIQAELTGMSAKLQAALRPEDIMTRAASSIAEALPSMLAKQLRDSQEMSMEGSICAPKTQQHGAQSTPQAPKMVSTSANSGNSSGAGADDDVDQQATSALKPQAHVARTDSMGEKKEEEMAEGATPTAEAEGEQQGERQLVVEGEGDAEEGEEEEERPVKRMCLGVDAPAAQLAASAGPASCSLEPMASQPIAPVPTLDLADLLAFTGAGPGSCGAGAPSACAGTARKGRRTNYVKMRELEISIQEARAVERQLRQAIAAVELQHASIQEENRQLWGAVAHINASLHAGHAVMLADALQQAAGPLSQPLSSCQDLSPLTATTVSGISPGDHLDDVFAGSPDPMCLAEACGMLFSPAPATTRLLGAGAGKAPQAAPGNKPRKLFEEELAVAAGCGGGLAACHGADLALLDDLPKLDFVH